MNRSVQWWLIAEYRRQEPKIAQDATPGEALSKSLQGIMRKWRKRFNEFAELTSTWFVRSTDKHVSASIQNSLRVEGMSVQMKATPEVKTVLSSIYQNQVSLIKSIPEQYLTQVETLVQQSVINGRDIAWLRDELEQRYGVTRRRAINIARDQNNKASQAIARERTKSAGITEGIWVHRSGGSKTYRHSHVKMNGTKFSLAEGCFDPHENRKVHPGELINCKCDFRPVIPGMEG